MYDLIPTILSIFAFIMGLMMIFCPKIMVKKEFREDSVQLAKTKKSGILIVICGVALFAVGILQLVK